MALEFQLVQIVAFRVDDIIVLDAAAGKSTHKPYVLAVRSETRGLVIRAANGQLPLTRPVLIHKPNVTAAMLFALECNHFSIRRKAWIALVFGIIG